MQIEGALLECYSVPHPYTASFADLPLDFVTSPNMGSPTFDATGMASLTLGGHNIYTTGGWAEAYALLT